MVVRARLCFYEIRSTSLTDVLPSYWMEPHANSADQITDPKLQKINLCLIPLTGTYSTNTSTRRFWTHQLYCVIAAQRKFPVKITVLAQFCGVGWCICCTSIELILNVKINVLILYLVRSSRITSAVFTTSICCFHYRVKLRNLFLEVFVCILFCHFCCHQIITFRQKNLA